MAQVEQIWSTDQVPPGQALAYWKDIICKNLLELRIGSANQFNFRGKIIKCPFGPLKANFISVSEQHVWRPATGSRRDEKGLFHLIHVRGGVQHVEQYNRQITVQPGNCILVDCQSSFDFRFPGGVEALVLEIRRDWLRSWMPAPEEAVAKLIDGKAGWGATLASALSNLTSTSVSSLAAPHTLLAEQIAVLLSLSVLPNGPAMTTQRRSLLRQVSETLRERCHEPELDPSSLANTLGLSRRYIHRLFAAGGTTFTHELYKVRLERAQRLLTDKRFDHISIGEIAWSCGFSAPSHFTRRFRDQFGMAPTKCRSGPRSVTIHSSGNDGTVVKL